MANVSTDTSTQDKKGEASLPLDMRQRILLVMSRLDAKPLYDHFIRLDYIVEQTDSGLYALTMLEHNPPSIVVCQKQTQDLSGLEVSELVDHDPMLADIALIVIHDYNEEDIVDNYNRRKKTIFLREDSSLMTVSKTVSRMLAQSLDPYSLEKPSPSILTNVKPKIPIEGLLDSNSMESTTTNMTRSGSGNPISTESKLAPAQPLTPLETSNSSQTTLTSQPASQKANTCIKRFDISRAQIRGKLQSISLFDLLNTLTSNCKTGRLCVRVGDTDGFVHLHNGVILHVMYAQWLAEPALEQLLLDTLNKENTPFFFGDIRFMSYDTALAEEQWNSSAITSKTDALLRNLALKLFAHIPTSENA